jgi:hypothetical protein
MNPSIFKRYIISISLLLATIPECLNAQQGSHSAEAILNGKMNYPPSPPSPYTLSEDGFAKAALSKTPPPGVHPRIIFSPQDIPSIRDNLKITETGKKLNALLKAELDSLHFGSSFVARAYQALSTNNIEAYQKLAESGKALGTEFSDKLFQSAVITALKLEALDCLLHNDKARGVKAATAISNWAIILEPEVKKWRSSLFANDASRWGSWHALGSFELFSKHHLGDAYDVSFPFMTKVQRDRTRQVIAAITNGTYTFAQRLPSHLRMWNWVNFSNCLPLLALSIEGEKGYDERVYNRGVETMRDYIIYNYSKQGSSTESLGYTTSGWKDGVPAVIAMARRGNNLMLIDRFKAISKWMMNCMLPHEGEWLNHGDLGNYPPGFHEVMLHKKFYPNDPVVNINYSQVLSLFNKRPADIKENLFELIIISAGVTDILPKSAKTAQPLDFYDEERGNLVARSSWDKNALLLNFECRPDGFFANHEHADRGNFNIAALGRLWTPEGARSPESRHHNVVTIDGKGQGMFAAPGKWLGMFQHDVTVFGACDTKYAYDWFYPKAIVGVDTNSKKFNADRFSSYRPEAVRYQNTYIMEKETHPNVVSRFRGFDLDDSGMWDEDPWTLRIRHNPVQYAYRTAGMIRGKHPYILVIDDIKKDSLKRLYEWNMLVANDLALISIQEEDAAQNFLGPRVLARTKNFHTTLILGSEKIPAVNGVYKPAQGEPLLMIRVIEKTEPETLEYDTRPSPRLELFEKKDAFSSPGIHLGPGGRTWGLAKRVVIPSRSTTPSFKVLIYPYRHGIDELPGTDFSDKTNLYVKWKDQEEVISFKMDNNKTTLGIKQNGNTILEVK